MVSNGGHTTEQNISIVTEAKHRAFHILFGNRKAEDIAGYLTAVWLDPSVRMVVEKKGQYYDPRQLDLRLNNVCWDESNLSA